MLFRSLVAQANFFLGVDSCMLHVADFCRVPSIGIFGPTQADEFGFRLGPNITIQADGGMRSIEVEMVRRAIESMLICPHQSETWNVTSGSRFLESAQGCSV